MVQQPSLNLMRYHGGKFRICSWVLSFFEDHETYVEPFGGSATILLNKPRSRVEIFNDLDAEVVNLFRVLQHPKQCDRLRALCDLTPYAREEYMLSREPSDDPVEQARRTLVRSYMAFGGLFTGRHTGFRADPSTSTRNTAHQWSRVSDVIASAVDRFKGVIVENDDALTLTPKWDSPTTLVFADPTYVDEARTGKGYRHEMTDAQHVHMVAMLSSLQARVVLSGYPSTLYDAMLDIEGWTRHEKADVPTVQGGSKRTEVVWIKPAGVIVPFDPALFLPKYLQLSMLDLFTADQPEPTQTQTEVRSLCPSSNESHGLPVDSKTLTSPR